MRSRPVHATPRLPRRRFLAGAARAVAAGLVAPGLARTLGCSPPPEEEEGRFVRVDVSALVPGERLLVAGAEVPFEVRASGAGISARSLLCTHQGCIVEWSGADRVYVCPCHDARFDEHGVPLYGPAKRPLRELPVERIGNEVRVDLRAPEA